MRIVQEASDRVVNYLNPDTRKPLIAMIEHQLIKRHVPALIEKVTGAERHGLMSSILP
jgi:hypothetical protein